MPPLPRPAPARTPALTRPPGGPGPHRAARVLAVSAAALVAAGAAMATAGGAARRIGPVDVRITLVPSLTGGTRLAVPPLGELAMDTHDGPVRVSARVEGLGLDAARGLLSGGTTSVGLQRELAADVRAALVAVGARSAVVAVLTGGLAGWVVTRRPRDSAVGALATAAVLVASGGVAAATARPAAVTEPTLTGLLTQAPGLIGGVRDGVARFDQYSKQVARLTANVTRLYGALSTLPVDAAGSDPQDTSTVRILWVSDIHDNPVTFAVMPSLVEQFAVAAVVDVGDISDHGTAAENRIYDPIAALPVPYVYVRGNHDSALTQAHLAAMDNVVVLDAGAVADVAGLRFAGTGDPQFTPEKSVHVDEGGVALLVERAGEELAAAVRASAADGRPVDVALVHRRTMAPPLYGLVPLVLDGHTHRRAAVVESGTLKLTQGSSGGAGLRTLEGAGGAGGTGQPLAMSVLHFDRETRRLLVVDEITIGGLGQRSVTVERHAASSYAAPPAPAS